MKLGKPFLGIRKSYLKNKKSFRDIKKSFFMLNESFLSNRKQFSTIEKLNYAQGIKHSVHMIRHILISKIDFFKSS